MESVSGEAPRTGAGVLIDRLSVWLAICGGGLVCLAGAMVTASVLGVWLARRPLPGVDQLVEVTVAVAVFAFLPFTQLRGGHILVDTLTLRAPPRLNSSLDGVWNLLLAGFFGLFTWGLFTGGLSARANGETMVELTWPIWPVYMVCAGLAGFGCLAGLVAAGRLLRGLR